MQVKLVSKTQVAPDYLKSIIDDTQKMMQSEALMIYIARVSSSNQNNPKYKGLLKHCFKEKHWSVFEMLDMTLEIITSRAIAQQILRHRSFSFQEFSQRYSRPTEIEIYDARRQADKDRQSSIDDLSESVKNGFIELQKLVAKGLFEAYQAAIDKGIAKECARFLLPLGTQTRLYMKGSLRSWIHYIQVRTTPSTQKEHRDIALAAKEILCREFPTIGKLIDEQEKE